MSDDKTTHNRGIALAVGTVFAAGLAAAPVAASADANPFQVNTLSGGYMLADKGGEGKCGEGRCGGADDNDEKSDNEGKCGEGRCGG